MRLSYTWAVWGACLVIGAALALAGALRPSLAPPSLQERVMAIAADVRCPECQGESAAVSNAAASIAIRNEIAADLRAGQSGTRILRELAAAYGEWILYKPPARGAFLLLWGAPFLALGGVGTVLARMWRRRSAEGSPPAAAGQPGGLAVAEPPTAGAVPPRDIERRLARFL